MSLAVYGRYYEAISPVLLLEAFDVNAHRSIPVKVISANIDRAGARKVRFEQQGQRPAVVKIDHAEAIHTLFIDAETELGSAQIEVSAPRTKADFHRAEAVWPVRLKCGNLRVLMFSDSGIPEAGVSGKVLIFALPKQVGATLKLVVGGKAIEARVEAWGGAIVDVLPASTRSLATIALANGSKSCKADFVFVARDAGVRVENVRLKEEGGQVALLASLGTRYREVYALLARRGNLGEPPGSLIDAYVLDVSLNRGHVKLPLPSKDTYQIRFTPAPLETGVSAKGSDVIVVPQGGSLALLEPIGEPELAQVAEAKPFILATLAAQRPIFLEQVANTSAQVLAALDKEKSFRDTALLFVFGASLVGLIVLMLTQVIPSLRTSRHLAGEADAETFIAPSWRALVPVFLVVMTLVFAVVALILVLQTL